MSFKPRHADDAVSEVVSFVLILALITAGVAITIAVISPELEKAQNLQHQTEAASSFANLKTGIDQLWIFDKPETTASLLLPPPGTLTINTPHLSFTHTEGQTTANLLAVSYTAEPNIKLAYEGGVVFENQASLLKHSTSDTHAIFICSDISEQTLATNQPILLQYIYHHADTYTNVTNLFITNSANTPYWQKSLKEIHTITLIDCSLTAVAVT